MRVLFVLRPGIESRSGGDLTQALFTKRALEEAGHEVEVAGTLEPDARGYRKLFLTTITQADEGCDFDFLKAPRVVATVPRDGSGS